MWRKAAARRAPASPARGAACVARSLRLARPNRAMSGKLSAKCPFRRAVWQKRCRNARSLLWPAWMTSLGEKADQAKRHDVASCSASKASRRRKNRALRRKTCQAIIRSVHFADNLPVNRVRLGITRAQRRLEALACKRSPPKPLAYCPLGGCRGSLLCQSACSSRTSLCSCRRDRGSRQAKRVVPAQLRRNHGPVSETARRSMRAGLRERTRHDYRQ